ncbi:hypothetical protein ANN_19225 [Periplaneta americana]|uniref:Uncharacterized protein n=1 Tax=Periplaneta americana TaxID=6978 RepID=A0ABQ8S9R8_PERAM|nr:hypothetical protein ANN_19225 [Periplaneta americana]
MVPVLDERSSGKPVTPAETVRSIQDANELNPQASTHRLSRELSVSQSTTWRIYGLSLINVPTISRCGMQLRMMTMHLAGPCVTISLRLKVYG